MNSQLTAIITVGIPASGKSTFARELIEADDSYVEVNRDWFRHNVVMPNTNNSTYKFTKARERQVTAECNGLIMWAAEHGRNIVCSDTNINPNTRNGLIDLFDALGYNVVVKFFDISYEEALRRDKSREHGVGHNVIYTMWLNYQREFKMNSRVITDAKLPKAIICDIDGTLAHMNGGRSPYDWSDVGQDSVDEIVKGILIDQYERGAEIIIVSGRDAICQTETYQWLNDNDIPYHRLFMRNEGDTRKDTIVKEEIFFEEINGKFNVVAVLDDRPSVCRMWATLGLRVIHFADQNKEF